MYRTARTFAMSPPVRRTRRGTLLAVLLMGAMALAQPADEPPDAGPATEAPPPAPAPPAPAPPAPAPQPPAPAPAPAPPRPKADAGTPPAPDAGTQAPPAPPPPRSTALGPLNERARAFFTALLAGETGTLVSQAELPFFLEDKRITSPEQLKSEWLNQLRSKRTDLLAFKGFEVLTPAEMEQRFGKLPARLSSWPIGVGRTYLVVANLSGRAAVALYHEVGGDWRIVAYHD